MTSKKMTPLHPGEILQEEFLKPMNLSQNRLALDIRVPARRINEIVHGKRRITADTALRLAKLFDTTAEFWIGLQNNVDMWDTLKARKDEYDQISPLKKKVA